VILLRLTGDPRIVQGVLFDVPESDAVARDHCDMMEAFELTPVKIFFAFP
jgi:hypothetical protein